MSPAPLGTSPVVPGFPGGGPGHGFKKYFEDLWAIGVRRFATLTERDSWADPPPLAMCSVDAENSIYVMSGGLWVVLYQPWTSFTPQIFATTTNPSLGSTGQAESRYAQVGGVVHYQGRLLFNGTGVAAGSGSYMISLPVPKGGGSFTQGVVWLLDNSDSNRMYVAVPDIYGTPTRLRFRAHGGTTEMSHTAPFAVAANDQIRWSVTYEPA